MKGLLRYSLERIDALNRFYQMEQQCIKDVVEAGIKKNSLGHCIGFYFSTLLNAEEVVKEEEWFKKLEECVNQYVEKIDVCYDENRVHFQFKNSDLLKQQGIEVDIRTARREYKLFQEMPELIGHNTLVMLITRFEEFISNLLEIICSLFPKKYLDKQLISFSEIVGCGVEEVRNKIISREVEALMRDKYVVWFKLFDEHGMKFSVCQNELEAFKEINARRNIIIHNQGCVNSSYLQEVTKTDARLNQRLKTDEKYIRETVNVIKTLMFIIYIEAIKLAENSLRKTLLVEAFDEAFNELCKENYYLCKTVFCAISQNKFVDTQYHCLSKVNYWISMKELGDEKDVIQEIQNFDVSALDPTFKLAKFLLLEDYDASIEMIERLWDDYIDGATIEEWPIFKQFRKTEQYRKLVERHSEEFTVTTLDVDEEHIQQISEEVQGDVCVCCE